jgi:hypothetical protein
MLNPTAITSRDFACRTPLAAGLAVAIMICKVLGGPVLADAGPARPNWGTERSEYTSGAEYDKSKGICRSPAPLFSTLSIRKLQRLLYRPKSRLLAQGIETTGIKSCSRNSLLPIRRGAKKYQAMPVVLIAKFRIGRRTSAI